MDPDEFKWSIINKECVFLLAEEENKILGFLSVNAKDAERPFKSKYAYLVNLVVKPEHRNKGIARELYLECEKILKKMNLMNYFSNLVELHIGKNYSYQAIQNQIRK